jgi:hypothetical protein
MVCRGTSPLSAMVVLSAAKNGCAGRRKLLRFNCCHRNGQSSNQQPKPQHSPPPIRMPTAYSSNFRRGTKGLQTVAPTAPKSKSRCLCAGHEAGHGRRGSLSRCWSLGGEPKPQKWEGLGGVEVRCRWREDEKEEGNEGGRGKG